MRRYRDGRISGSGDPVRARTAEDVLRHVGQTFAMVGAADPRQQPNGTIDLQLTRVMGHCIQSHSEGNPHGYTLLVADMGHDCWLL